MGKDILNGEKQRNRETFVRMRDEKERKGENIVKMRDKKEREREGGKLSK